MVIRSTSEHPFYVSDEKYIGKWVAAGELQEGQWVLCDDGRWARVEEVADSGEWEVVYNMRVANSHTYFVGEEGRGYAVWVHNAYQVEMSILDRFRPALSTTLWDNSDPMRPRWRYQTHSLNMNSSKWESFQIDPPAVANAGSPMPRNHEYVYLVVNRKISDSSLEIVKVGKIGKSKMGLDAKNWATRIGGNNGYRYPAILGMELSVYAFDLNSALGAAPTTTSNATPPTQIRPGTLETDVRTALWGAANRLPGDGQVPQSRRTSPSDPYNLSVRRAVQNNPNSFIQGLLSSPNDSPLAGLTPISVDLNIKEWRGILRNASTGLQANHRYLYALEARNLASNDERKILKIGLTGVTMVSAIGTYVNRFEQYINLPVNYYGSAAFNYQGGVTAHIYDITALPGVSTATTSSGLESSMTDIESRVRDRLYAAGFRQPLEHDNEVNPAPGWRNQTDDLALSRYDRYDRSARGIIAAFC